jgi:hypothetical protein
MIFMYEWLPSRIGQAKQTLQDFSLNWESILNPPASEAEITACEAVLGMQLPRSYRNFLLQWNGAYLFRNAKGELPDGPFINLSCDIDTAIFLHGTQTIVELNEQGNCDEMQNSLLRFASVGMESDYCGFDIRQIEGEPVVLDCGACFPLEECLATKISNSFVEWLEKIFDQVVVEKKEPIFWFNLQEELNRVAEEYKKLNLARENDQQSFSNPNEKQNNTVDEISVVKSYKRATATILFFNNNQHYF